MTLDEAMTTLSAGLIGFAVTQILVRLRLEAPPRRLVRENFRGVPVPVVLGGPLVIGSLVSLGSLSILASLGWTPARTGSVGVAVAVCLAGMGLAGSWDDRRGDERPRGFSGHLGAARRGALTGGLVKLGAGGVCGAIAGVLVSSGWRTAVEIALLVALTANLVNLLDRAPGRASKASLLLALPLVAFEAGPWTIAAGGLLGATLACLPFDLKERAMLGDAGANPLGAVVGLGLGAAPEEGRIALIVLFTVLNLASERWSFSAFIDRTPVLRAFDRLGRRFDP